MRKLVRWVLLLIVTNTAAYGIAIMLGRQQPEPTAITELHLKDCRLPCWIGITPGKTNFDDGEALLYKVFGGKVTPLLSQGSERIFTLELDATHSWNIRFLNRTSANTGVPTIDDLSLTLPTASDPAQNELHPGDYLVTVGDLMATFGLPTKIGPDHGEFQSDTVLSYGDYFLAEIPFQDQREADCLTPDTHQDIDKFVFTDPALGYPYWLVTPSPWRGFIACYDTPHD